MPYHLDTETIPPYFCEMNTNSSNTVRTRTVGPWTTNGSSCGGHTTRTGAHCCSVRTVASTSTLNGVSTCRHGEVTQRVLAAFGIAPLMLLGCSGDLTHGAEWGLTL